MREHASGRICAWSWVTADRWLEDRGHCLDARWITSVKASSEREPRSRDASGSRDHWRPCRSRPRSCHMWRQCRVSLRQPVGTCAASYPRICPARRFDPSRCLIHPGWLIRPTFLLRASEACAAKCPRAFRQQPPAANNPLRTTNPGGATLCGATLGGRPRRARVHKPRWGNSAGRLRSLASNAARLRRGLRLA